MKISVLCLPLALCFSLVNAVGLDGNLAITTASGRLQPIRDLKVGDEVVCYSKDLQQQTSTIKGICEITVDSTVAITTADDIVLHTSPSERFFLPKENAWICAKSLKEGDCLLNENMDAIAITKVEQQDGAQQLFVITVDKHHNFLASEGKYLVHNGPVSSFIGYWATKVTCYTGLVIGGAVTGKTAAKILNTEIKTTNLGVNIPEKENTAFTESAAISGAVMGGTIAAAASGTIETVSACIGGILMWLPIP